MISVKFVFASVLTAAANAQMPNVASPVLLKPGKDATKCLTAASNSSGARVTIQSCTSDASQQWTFQDGSVKLFENTKCLDVTDGCNVDGTKLQIWECFSGNQNQQFWYTGDNRLAWTDHGKCVDLTDGKLNDGNQIQVWTCTDGNLNQVWNAVQVTGANNSSKVCKTYG